MKTRYVIGQYTLTHTHTHTHTLETDDDVGLNVLGYGADVLETNCDSSIRQRTTFYFVRQAVLEVSEQGTEASAATVVIMSESAPLSPFRVKADHPFFYVIRDNRSKAILFMGKYSAQA